MLIFAEALDVAAEGAVWYGGGSAADVRSRPRAEQEHGHRHSRALVRLHGRRAPTRRAPAGQRPDSGRARGDRAAPRRSRRRRRHGRLARAVPQALTARGGPTRAVPAQAAAAHEPGVVVADVPGGHLGATPGGARAGAAVLRVLAGAPDARRMRAIEYAHGLPASTRCAPCTSAHATGTTRSSGSRSTTRRSRPPRRLDPHRGPQAHRRPGDRREHRPAGADRQPACAACAARGRSRSSGACSSSRTSSSAASRRGHRVSPVPRRRRQSTASSASSARPRCSRPPTATSARRSTTRSASSPASRSGSRRSSSSSAA